MAYATINDVQARMTRTLSETERGVCLALLDDAAALIDSLSPQASADAKKTVSCRMVVRAIGDGGNAYPIGATQGSMSGLGYSQSWSVAGGSQQLYLDKTDKLLLGASNKIGSYSPVEELAHDTRDNGLYG